MENLVSLGGKEGRTSFQIYADEGSNLGPCSRKAEILRTAPTMPALWNYKLEINWMQRTSLMYLQVSFSCLSPPELDEKCSEDDKKDHVDHVGGGRAAISSAKRLDKQVEIPPSRFSFYVLLERIYMYIHILKKKEKWTEDSLNVSLLFLEPNMWNTFVVLLLQILN